MTRTFVTMFLFMFTTICCGQVTINGPNVLDVKEADLFFVEGLTIEEFKSCVVYVRPVENKPQVLVLQTVNNLPVLYVKGMSAGSFELMLDINIPDKYELIFHQLVIGKGVPDIVPDPLPVPTGKCNIAIVFERTELDNYPKEQQQIISSIVIRDKMTALGHTIVEGGICDKDIVDSEGNVPDDLKVYLEAAKGMSLPVIVLGSDSGVIGYPLPGNELELIEMLLIGGAK